MARGYFIRQGDKTDCGGTVMAGDKRVMMFGVAHAREGDPVTCGKDGKVYQITGGVSTINSHGKYPAGTLDSFSTCPCRARLIATVFKATYEKKYSPVPLPTGAAAQPLAEPNTELPGEDAKSAAHGPDYFSNTAPCNHLDRMEELASYIADEMNRNINHPSVLEMKELNSFDPDAETAKYNALPFYLRLGRGPDFHNLARGKQAKAFVLWTERVGQNRPWDHKPMIKSKFEGAWQKQGEYDYFHDIWSNIHYGYVGIASGFSESILFDGAGAEQIISDTIRKIQDRGKHPGPSRTPGVEGLRAWDDAPDRESIQIGVNLYRRYPQGGITSKTIMEKVLEIEPTRWVKGVRPHECK